MIRIIYKQPHLEPKEMRIPNKLQVIQNLINGDIKTTNAVKGVVMIENEEGKLRDMEANFVYGFRKVYGPAVFAGVSKEGQLVSLTPMQKNIVHAMLEK